MGKLLKSNEYKQNPFEGKRVVFVENENEALNADGIRGHLEVIGNEERHFLIYDDVIKRVISIKSPKKTS